MKKLQKLELIDLIGRELQSRMTFSEIDSYFEAYGIPTDHEPSYYSKLVYVKEVLPAIDDTIVIEIANELEINHPSLHEIYVNTNEEISFWKPGYFKLFLSHLSSHKDTMGNLKSVLEPYGISAFVAHEDIEPTMDWQEEIEKGLFSMDAICAVLIPGYKESDWTDQEVGVAIGRNILVIPIRKDLDPYGFIGKFQGFQGKNKTVGQVAKGIFQIISTHKKTRQKYLKVLSELFLSSNTSDEALERLKVINELKSVPDEMAGYIRDNSTENDNLKATKVLTQLNKFLKRFNYPVIKLEEFEKFEDYNDDLPF